MQAVGNGTRLQLKQKKQVRFSSLALPNGTIQNQSYTAAILRTKICPRQNCDRSPQHTCGLTYEPRYWVHWVPFFIALPLNARYSTFSHTVFLVCAMASIRPGSLARSGSKAACTMSLIRSFSSFSNLCLAMAKSSFSDAILTRSTFSTASRACCLSYTPFCFTLH